MILQCDKHDYLHHIILSKLWLQRCAVHRGTVQAGGAELCQAHNKLKLFNLASLRTDIPTGIEGGGVPHRQKYNISPDQEKVINICWGKGELPWERRVSPTLKILKINSIIVF